MNVTLWGTRGSVSSPGPDTVRYGGNTSCVAVRDGAGDLLVLDAGTGIRRLGAAIEPGKRVDLLLTHLHMDHIQGLGFFDPLFRDDEEVHVWGPSSTLLDLRQRLIRYLSPPLFPVRLRELPCRLEIHDVTDEKFKIGRFTVTAHLVCHPGPTVGYRISEGGTSVAYLPDHEPALGVAAFPGEAHWTSGYDLAEGVDLLIHDAQYDSSEYPAQVGWGHSTMQQAASFARLCGAKRLVTFHHDPRHSDAHLDEMTAELGDPDALPYELIAGTEGASFDV